MTPRDLGLVVFSVLACVFGLHDAWTMRSETNVARIETETARAEVEALIELRHRAEGWLSSSPASGESGVTSSASWIEYANREGLAVSRVSTQGENWSVSVEGPLSGVARAITSQTEAVSIRPGLRLGHVRAEFTMANVSKPVTSFSRSELETLLASATRSPESVRSADTGLMQVFRADEAGLPPTRSVPALIDLAGARNLAGLPSPADPLSSSAPSSVPYDYLGRIEGGTRGVCGVFKSVDNGLIVSVRQGETLGGWKLVRVLAEEVVFASPDDPSRTVKLARRIQSASS